MTTPRACISTAFLAALASVATALPWQVPTEEPLIDPVSIAAAPKAQCFWNRDAFLPKSPPDDIPEVALDAIMTWWPFAHENDYRIDVERDGRVLLLSDYRERRTRKQMIHAEDTLAFFDEHLPDGPLDFEETMSTRRLTMPAPMDGPVVLVRLRDNADQQLFLDHLVAGDERLASWADSMRDREGFRLSDPSVAAWVVDPEVEEWREENELVHQLAQCMLEGRFGRQPYWMAQGIAWYAELEVTDGIYCFPNREGFVGVTEHGGWESDLRRVFRKRKDEPLRMDELTAWRRGTFDEGTAALSWGLVTYLIDHAQHEDELEDEEEDRILADIAREMGAHRQTFGIQTQPDGSWTTLPNYELPSMIQRQIVEHHAGENVWDESTRSFWMGSRYKPSRTR